MGEGTIGLGQSVQVLLPLDHGPLVVEGVQQLGGKLLRHPVPGLLPRCRDEPLDGEELLSLRPQRHGHVIQLPASPDSRGTHDGFGVVDGLVKDLHGIEHSVLTLLALRQLTTLDDFQRLLEDVLGE